MQVPLAVVVTLLCAVGLYVSIFMLRKTIRAGRGGLAEPSVVQTPRASLYAGIPNAALGIAYYVLAGVAIWFTDVHAVVFLLAAVAILAAITSMILAYSLLYVTRMACKFCWTSHAVNWSLAALLIWRSMNPSS